MARPKGSRSAEYEERREALLASASAVLIAAHPDRLSFREIAAACGVSQPTLRHYFGTRDGLIAAHLERFGRMGDPYLARLATTDRPFAESLREAAMMVKDGFTLDEVAGAQVVALSEGLASEAAGPEYLAHVLEPILQAVSRRLALHVERGEMRATDPRFVATIIVSPIVIACLHQEHLGGRDAYPLDMFVLTEETTRAVVRAYGVESDD